MSRRDLPQTPLGWLILAWGVGGVFVILLNPVLRLGRVALEALEGPLGPEHWLIGGVWVAIMGYAEGYRGFHKQFAPRVVVRSLELANRPTWIPALFAPLTAMGLIHATRKRLIVSRSLLVGIVLIVVLVRQLPQPWRGVIDVGVVVGLGTGLVSLVGWCIAALRGHTSTMAADLPE